LRRAVVDDRLGQFEERLFRNRSRTRGEQTRLHPSHPFVRERSEGSPGMLGIRAQPCSARPNARRRRKHRLLTAAQNLEHSTPGAPDAKTPFVDRAERRKSRLLTTTAATWHWPRYGRRTPHSNE